MSKNGSLNILCDVLRQSVEPTPELLTDYRELRAAFLRARLFRSSKVYYTLKTLTNLALLAGSIAVISVNQSMLGIMLSAILMATCFQQCGWLSHDFLHHQVLPYPLQHHTMPCFPCQTCFLCLTWKWCPKCQNHTLRINFGKRFTFLTS